MKLNDILYDKPQLLIEMPQEDLEAAEKTLQRIFMQTMGLEFLFRKHPRDRTIKPGAREENVTKEEVISVLARLIQKYRGKILGARQHGREYEATVTDNETGLNIVFAIDYGVRKKHNLFKVITLMKNKNFNPYWKDDARFFV